MGYELRALFRLGDRFKILRAANKPAQAMSTMVYSFLNMETVSLWGLGKDGEGAEETFFLTEKREVAYKL